jgi:hypothetical protein
MMEGKAHVQRLLFVFVLSNLLRFLEAITFTSPSLVEGD